MVCKKKKGFSEVKSRKFVIEQTPRSLPSNLFRGHVEKIEKITKKTQILTRLVKTFGIKRCQRYFLMNLHLTASSEGVNCIWLLWGWTSLRESCQLSDLHKSDSLARGITLILLGSSTKHSSFIIQHVEEVGLLQMFLMESANIAKSERQSCQKFWKIAIPQKRRYTLQPYCKTANKSSKEFWKFAPRALTRALTGALNTGQSGNMCTP